MQADFHAWAAITYCLSFSSFSSHPELRQLHCAICPRCSGRKPNKLLGHFEPSTRRHDSMIHEPSATTSYPVLYTVHEFAPRYHTALYWCIDCGGLCCGCFNSLSPNSAIAQAFSYFMKRILAVSMAVGAIKESRTMSRCHESGAQVTNCSM